MAKPTNPALYARVKAEAKRKFDVYPSAYANAWLVKTYKNRGGGYSGSDPRKGMMGYKTAPKASDSNDDMLKRQVS